MKYYNKIFGKVEATLKEKSKLSEEDLNSRLGKFKTYKDRNLSNADYFEVLTEIIFYSGS